jgi:hypothetical protein
VRKDIGSEYFEGNIIDMLYAIQKICNENHHSKKRITQDVVERRIVIEAKKTVIEITNDKPQNMENVCTYCKRGFEKKSNLKRHSEKCSTRLEFVADKNEKLKILFIEDENKKLKDDLEQLKKQLEKQAK